MTEDEWRTSTRPGPMLDWLEANHRATLRKKRLFVFSACRLGWADVRPEVRRLIEAAEDYVERLDHPYSDPPDSGRFHDALLSLVRVTLTNLESTTFHLVGFAVNSDGKAAAYIAAVNDLAEVAPQTVLASLLREQFGNPFRKVRWVSARLRDRIDLLPRTVRPADLLLSREWLTWEGGIVMGLAQAIDEERAWDRMPILADALEDAGCAESALLDHLRQGETHARGCWALDLLLGRE
jgi:hypothetical protein